MVTIAVIILLLSITVLNDRRGHMRPRDQAYSTPTDAKPLCLDVYLPKQSGSVLRPTILVVHGGAWCSGKRWQVAGIARRLASAGNVAVSVIYRLAPHALSRQKNPDATNIENQLGRLRWRGHTGAYLLDRSTGTTALRPLSRHLRTVKAVKQM